MILLLVFFDAAGVIGASLLALLLANHVRLALVGTRLRHALLADVAPLPPSPNVPDVLVQIPVFNEAETVLGALEAASRLDWPRDRLTIQLLDDSTDDTSRIAAARIAALAAGGHRIDHRRRADRAGYKAGALAAGLAADEAPYVAVLDADFRPPADWLRWGIAHLDSDERAAFVQFRFEIGNRDENALTRAQSLLVDAHFLLEQTGRAAAGEPFQFNGTAGIWRRRAIADIGGWSADTLAEDLDIALRAYACGWHGRLALMPPVPCEAPAAFGAWRVQQQRWSRGFVAVAAKHLAGPSVLAPGARLATMLLLGLQLALPAFLATLVGFVGDAALRGFGLWHAALLAIATTVASAALVALTLPAFLALRRGSPSRYAASVCALPLLLAALAFANSAAILAAPFGSGHVFVRTKKSGRH